MFIIPFLAFSVAILILFFIKSKNLKYLILLLLFTLNFNLIIQSLNLSSSIINLPSEKETQLHIKSVFNIYTRILHKLNLSCEKHIINGTMMSREDGFIEIDN
ncbi:MAG TPA: hypothetical protein EYG69_05415 [Campylobacterales bacterium]|nr:hypothetical protein [Campylobacterales bacterium]